MVFHWSLSDSKSPQVSRTLLDLSNAVVYSSLYLSSDFLDFQSLYQNFMESFQAHQLRLV